MHTVSLLWCSIRQILIDQGAQVNAKMNDGGTALMNAAAGGHFLVVKVTYTVSKPLYEDANIYGYNAVLALSEKWKILTMKFFGPMLALEAIRFERTALWAQISCSWDCSFSPTGIQIHLCTPWNNYCTLFGSSWLIKVPKWTRKWTIVSRPLILLKQGATQRLLLYLEKHQVIEHRPDRIKKLNTQTDQVFPAE